MSEGGMYTLISLPPCRVLTDADFIHDAVKLIKIPPGLPSKKPTAPTWQNPPHPTVSNAQSKSLAPEADVVIIGSGITGIGAAHYLLHNNKHLKVIILEARTAVSGATGRNGGHLVSDSDALFPALVKAVGVERAIETVRFSEGNIRRLKELLACLRPEEREAVEYREVMSATSFTDKATFEDAVQSLRDFLKAVPEGDIKYKVFNKGEATRVS